MKVLKDVNDRDGHAAGDAHLVAAARALRSAVRTSDPTARLGGDEFGVLMAGCTEDRAAERVELITAAQGVDYHQPLVTSPRLQQLHAAVRAISPHLEADRYWADEMAALQSAVVAGTMSGGFLLGV